MTLLYVVEHWSDETFTHPLDNSVCHEVGVAHYSTTKEEAVDWCARHLDYCGTEETDGYYPWHFKVRKVAIDEDSCCVVRDTNEVVAQIDPKEVSQCCKCKTLEKRIAKLEELVLELQSPEQVFDEDEEGEEFEWK